jgi:hypothetical protein
MKKLIILIALIGIIALTPWISIQTANGEQPPETLCLPGVYPIAPEDCLPLGPSSYLANMADTGFTFPIQPLASQTPNPELAVLPYYYAKVTTDDAPVFFSLDDAVQNNPPKRFIEKGFDYISYIDVISVENRRYYMIAPGEWMLSGDLSSNVVTSPFMGQEFVSTPERNFGWILQPVETQSDAGLFQPTYTGHYLNRFEMVQVYAQSEVDNVLWYLVAPDQWIEARFAALVYPANSPPDGVENGRWVEINLFEQTVAVYEDNHMVFATLVSTGVPGWWTRPGLFQITEKLESTPMTGTFEADRSDYYYLEDVPWTMYFDQSRALHGAYWHNQFGYERSHGCANLSPGDSQWLYEWANIGDWVYVWDPSGQTPEDPALYSAGGA